LKNSVALQRHGPVRGFALHRRHEP